MSMRARNLFVLILVDIGSFLSMGNLTPRIPHIGIVAGTAEGAALCYRTICLEAEHVMGRRYVHPEITLHSSPLHLYLNAIDRNDWRGVAALMSHSASKLARVGADFLICPNNTLHQAIDLVESPLPWLHIAKPVLEEIIQHGWRRVGILGTQIVMEGSIYSHALKQRDVETVIPAGADRVRIQHMIRSELIAGRFTSDSRLFLQKVISEMADEGVEAVILGCTELPLFLSEEQSILPMLDSTRLLARAALRYGVQREWHPGEERETGRRCGASFTDRVLCADQN
jgi:aspartate racemase